jgi:hypothetical protein
VANFHTERDATTIAPPELQADTAKVDFTRFGAEAMHRLTVGCAVLVLMQCIGAAVAAEFDVRPLVDTIKRVDKFGKGHREAAEAVRQLQQVKSVRPLDVLKGMDDAGPLAANWLRGAFETVAQRELVAGKLPADRLEAFVVDRSHGDQARRLAYEWLGRVDASAPDRMLPSMLDDPSLELRYDALARRLREIESDEEKGGTQRTIAARYREALVNARDPDQVKTIVEKLKKLGEEVDLARHFGFVQHWKLIGPFDNRDGKGFAAVYPPEQKVDFAASHTGKSGELGWKDFSTDDPYGLVDLNRALGKHMGAVGYAAVEFASDRERPIELRMGCINACKIWLNGELLLAREVYHTGMEVDQYVGKGKLKRGRNVILVKVCQNEQSEDWAQNWQFQLRVCDSRGTAVHSKADKETRRPGDKETSR